jgi:hypothetical protein
MTVAELIQEARYEDPSFTESRHTDRVLRSRVADYQRHLARRVADVAPEELTDVHEIDLPLEDHEAGHELAWSSTYLRVLNEAEGVHVNGGVFPIEVIPHEARFEPTRTTPAWIMGGRLHLRGDAEDWADVVKVRVFYVPSPEAHLHDHSCPLFGELARSAYIAHLAYRMATRSPREVQRDLNGFRADWLACEEQFLEAMQGRHVTSDRVRRVW